MILLSFRAFSRVPSYDYGLLLLLANGIFSDILVLIETFHVNSPYCSNLNTGKSIFLCVLLHGVVDSLLVFIT